MCSYTPIPDYATSERMSILYMHCRLTSFQIRLLRSWGGVVVVAVVGLLWFCEAQIGRWLYMHNFSQRGVKLKWQYVNSIVGCSGGCACGGQQCL